MQPNDRRMRAISLWRPWPWAFFHAGKRIENRGWPPPRWTLGEWVAMHAALRFDDEALARMQRGDFGDEAMEAVDSATDHPTGIVGAMRVVGAFELPEIDVSTHASLSEYDGLLDSELSPEPRVIGTVPDEARRSPWAFGPWCWVIDRVVQLSTPVPCPGHQRLWILPDRHEGWVRGHLPTRRHPEVPYER